MKDRAAAAATSENRNAPFLAKDLINFRADPIPVAHDDEILARFPEAEQGSAFAGLAHFQEGFFPGEVFGRRGQCPIEELHEQASVLVL